MTAPMVAIAVGSVLSGLLLSLGGLIVLLVLVQDDQRLAESLAQGLQLVHGFRVDLDRAGAATGDLGGREVRPTPCKRGHVAPVGVGQGGHGGSSK